MDLYNFQISSIKPTIENYFKVNIFPNPKLLDSLKYINKNLITKYTIPNIRLKLKVSTLYSNILYRYNSLRAFPQ